MCKQDGYLNNKNQMVVKMGEKHKFSILLYYKTFNMYSIEFDMNLAVSDVSKTK